MLDLILCAALAIQPVHNVTVRGSTYQVTELAAVKREHLPWYNLLRLKRGAKYHEYKLLDTYYTLKIYDPEYKLVKSALKDVPDNRSFEEKHPLYQPTISTINTAASILRTVLDLF